MTEPKKDELVATTNDLKNGLVLNLDNQLWQVLEFQHVKPGKGPAFVRTKLKNVISGKIIDKTFNAGTKVETANVDRRDMQYLYHDGTDYVFMDAKDYDQVNISAELVGDAANYMLENQDLQISFHEGTPLSVELPPSVELTITHTEPGLQGDRSTGGRSRRPLRPATRSRCPCSSKRASRSRSTPAAATTSVASSKWHRHVPEPVAGLSSCSSKPGSVGWPWTNSSPCGRTIPTTR